AAHTVATTSRPGRPVRPRVIENGRVLHACYRNVALEIQQQRSHSPAAEALAADFTVVDQQLRQILSDLPPAYYRLLPSLADGFLEGYPRVFGLAWAYVAHTDSRFAAEGLRDFVDAYQRVQPLTIGELWAAPLTLRVILIENLRRLAESIVRCEADREQADRMADRLLGADGRAPAPAFEGGPAEPSPAFAAQLLMRLQYVEARARPALQWLERCFRRPAGGLDELVRAEHQRQGAVNITVQNIIASLRAIALLDAAEFFESLSLVDACLRRHSAFADMDFATRDAYRHAIEDLARGSGVAELAIAERVTACARQPREPDRAREADPGFYLIAEGRRQLERELGYRPGVRLRAARACRRAGLPAYLGALALLAAAALALPVAATRALLAPKALLLMALLALLPASDIAMALLNRGVAAALGPRRLPRMEFRRGPPPGLRTLVAMPVLLANLTGIEENLARLEIHYLANKEGELHFALLSDWLDSPAAAAAGDEVLLAAARAGIARLNQRYGVALSGGARFLLFHRRRIWNPSQRCWMGWERKRGKLHELNRLLRGATDTSFLPASERAPAPPSGIRFVLTLDADTRMPRGAADRLVATMAHPLNQPQFCRGRIVAGYALAQPRITPLLPGDRGGSWFQWASSAGSGIDLYAGAISDIYQDLFQEGSYTGKGIYDVDAFEAALAGKVPINALLSHDLFEGIAARTALASDIELFEE
ncbi:MAG TPA: protein ndvB, partial [Terriglobales bacterium]|nr:protein ndvB [Terriglobales bacterium]